MAKSIKSVFGKTVQIVMLSWCLAGVLDLTVRRIEGAITNFEISKIFKGDLAAMAARGSVVSLHGSITHRELHCASLAMRYNSMAYCYGPSLCYLTPHSVLLGLVSATTTPGYTCRIKGTYNTGVCVLHTHMYMRIHTRVSLSGSRISLGL